MQKSFSFTSDSLKPVVEALIFVSDEPLSIDRIAEIIPGTEETLIREAISALIGDYEREGRGIQIIEVAEGFKMCTRAEFSSWISALFTEKKKARLSTQALETLAVIAYKQPITKAEIEQIRGVNIGGTIKTLLDRNLLRILGKKEAPGRPIMYGTTRDFLEYFGLSDLSALPTLKEFSELGLNEEITFAESEQLQSGEATGGDEQEELQDGEAAGDEETEPSGDASPEDSLYGGDSVAPQGGGDDPREEGDC